MLSIYDFSIFFSAVATIFYAHLGGYQPKMLS